MPLKCVFSDKCCPNPYKGSPRSGLAGFLAGVLGNLLLFVCMQHQVWVCSENFAGPAESFILQSPWLQVDNGWKPCGLWMERLTGQMVHCRLECWKKKINNWRKLMLCKQYSNLNAQFWMPFSVCKVWVFNAQTYRCRFCFALKIWKIFYFHVRLAVSDEPGCQRELIIIPTPAPLNKALMRLWIQFNERDRCSLGPDGLETRWQLDSDQVTCLWY